MAKALESNASYPILSPHPVVALPQTCKVSANAAPFLQHLVGSDVLHNNSSLGKSLLKFPEPSPMNDCGGGGGEIRGKGGASVEATSPLGFCTDVYARLISKLNVAKLLGWRAWKPILTILLSSKRKNPQSSAGTPAMSGASMDAVVGLLSIQRLN